MLPATVSIILFVQSLSTGKDCVQGISEVELYSRSCISYPDFPDIGLLDYFYVLEKDKRLLCSTDLQLFF